MAAALAAAADVKMMPAAAVMEAVVIGGGRKATNEVERWPQKWRWRLPRRYGASANKIKVRKRKRKAIRERFSRSLPFSISSPPVHPPPPPPPPPPSPPQHVTLVKYLYFSPRLRYMRKKLRARGVCTHTHVYLTAKDTGHCIGLVYTYTCVFIRTLFGDEGGARFGPETRAESRLV